MKTKVFLLATLLAMTSMVFAQESNKRFGLELNSGASFATKKIGGTKLNTGFGFEGLLHYRFMPHLGVYGGWGWNRFGAENSFMGKDFCFEETGYIFGLEFKHPINESGISYFVRGGGLYNHIEIENDKGETVKDSKHGFGWQAAAGIDINLGKNWSLTPGVKFNYLSRDTDFEGTNKTLDYQYLSARIGIVKKF